MNRIKTAILALLIISCSAPSKEDNKDNNITDSEPKMEYPDLLSKVLEAHGGLDKWKYYGSLQYEAVSTLGGEKRERQSIDLYSRKVLIESDNYKLGMDGENVWVAPNKEAFGEMSPRFYHNLLFYFFSIPFVFADPGIQYEELGTRTLDSITYDALKISYQGGVGDASNDEYIGLFDQETHQLKLLLYTVTYFSGEKHNNFNALKYDWQKANGLLVPSAITGYKYEADTLGDIRYKTEFQNVSFRHEDFADEMFEMPESAEIDSLKQR
ncbi:DUF6503 family protein [Fulvivirga ligni]|uniref:DUF6503 family protein n=1 Tax=Fulvivirga ligni TaxID=2904246 RepID=UPI001F427C91|nr:DUF6503 family protein [Fulvivirga ligni]UII20621.1 hypothetical protein LVD16_22525 [Fulvivirga ligni]